MSAAQPQSDIQTAPWPGPQIHQYRSFASSARGTKTIFLASASRSRSISLSRNAPSSPILSLVKTLNSSWLPGGLCCVGLGRQLFCDIIRKWSESRRSPAVPARRIVLPPVVLVREYLSQKDGRAPEVF